jgi:methionyl-tRNA synthetase
VKNQFYITTPIYYPNAEPHLGHVYTTICADVTARFHRLVGDETFFLTGTDEHGVKMVRTAARQGVAPHDLAEGNVRVFQALWHEIGITNDDFIRTTSERHKQSVGVILQRLLANGDIYLGTYEGWYDEGQEEFVTETEAKERNYLAFNRKPLVRYAEPSYFFRLTKYLPALLAHLAEHPEFIRPESRYNEVVSKLKAGVEDLSISRTTLEWGIPLPNNPSHVLYVWIDALSNYISALGYGSTDETRFRRFWPVDVHLLGKEILWFHAVYWPCLLLALGESLPWQLVAHGWWLSEGRKMSKTEGNFIGLDKLRSAIATYGIDSLRYYLLRTAPFGNDLNWSDGDLERAFDELAKVLGNCLNRIVKMIGSYRGGLLPPAVEPDRLEEADRALLAQVEALPVELEKAYRAFQLQRCALLPIELARAINVYIEVTAPFRLAKDPSKAGRLETVLSTAALGISRALTGLLPVLPNKAAEGLAQLGIASGGRSWQELTRSPLPLGPLAAESSPLFRR